MLGQQIADPEYAENGGKIRGMGLLDTETVFRTEKTRTRIKGKVNAVDGFFACLSDVGFEGYEIHMGETCVCNNKSEKKPFTTLSDNRTDGAYSGSVYGTYIHGFFDSKDISERIVRTLFGTKGLVYQGIGIDRKTYKENQYNLLAATVREHVDMELIYRILEEGI